jgi:tetratricopeptide (TPR) repeat protein
VPEATAAGQQAVTFARDHSERGNEAWALRVLGAAAAHRAFPDADQAESHYRQALALAEELGMRPLAAHCHLGLGALYQKLARNEEAQVELSTAAELYRAMEMPFWLKEAEAVLTQAAR